MTRCAGSARLGIIGRTSHDSRQELISYTSSALIDMAEILFSREKVPLNVSKNKLVSNYAVIHRPSMGVARSG